MNITSALDNLCREFEINESKTKASEGAGEKKLPAPLRVEKTESVSTESDGSGKHELEDKEYIKSRMKALIDDNVEILSSLKDQLEEGATAQLFNLYSNLSKRVGDNIMYLAKIDGMITDIQMKDEMNRGRGRAASKYERDIQGQSSSTKTEYNIMNNLSVTSEEVLRMLDSVKSGSGSPIKTVTRDELPEFDLS